MIETTFTSRPLIGLQKINYKISRIRKKKSGEKIKQIELQVTTLSIYLKQLTSLQNLKLIVTTTLASNIDSHSTSDLLVNFVSVMSPLVWATAL